MALILLIEDEDLLRWGLKRQIEQRGHVVHEAATLAEAEADLREHRPDVVLLDLKLPDGNGLDFMASEKAALTESLIIVVTAMGQVEAAVRAMKLGAFDFLAKPVKEADLLALLDQAITRLSERNAAERHRREREASVATEVVAVSSAMRGVLEQAATVAASPAPTVLVQGETGTGKEVVARYIHARSSRSAGPLLTINCLELPEALVEQELFGHEKGAWPEAASAKKGLLELSHGGTLVLDEVGELSLQLQGKLLRFVEERTIRRVGGAREIFVDARVLALSNRGLEESVRGGSFRSELYYRLASFPIVIPPLRDRRDDIVPLAQHFVDLFGKQRGRSYGKLLPEVRELLLRHDWPGNVRELRNLIERACILERGGSVTTRYLTVANAAEGEPAGATPPLADAEMTLDEMEYQLVRRAMEKSAGNQSRAARALGITRDQVRYRLKRYRDEGRWDLALRDDEPEENPPEGPPT